MPDHTPQNTDKSDFTVQNTLEAETWTDPTHRRQERSPEDLLEKLASQDPDKVVAAFSGGHDSATMAHEALRSNAVDVDELVHIDTGVGIPETRQYVRDRADEWNVPLSVVGSDYRPERREYYNLVTSYGFPGSAVHYIMYINLKEVPLENYLQDQPDDTVILSGVRRAESRTRVENIDKTGFQRKLGVTWCSPLAYVDDDEMAKLRSTHSLVDSPVYDTYGQSGECLCGAHASRDELQKLKTWHPDAYRYISHLESLVIDEVGKGNIPTEHALWGHSNTDVDAYGGIDDPQQKDLGMCQDCTDRCPPALVQESESVGREDRLTYYTDRALSRGQLYYCVPCNILTDDPKSHREAVHEFGRETPPAHASPRYDGSHTDPEAEADGDTATDGPAWDIRSIAMLESQYRGAIITEEGADETTHCTHSTEHEWTEDQGVLRCRECGCFNLSDGSVEPDSLRLDDPSTDPRIDPAHQDSEYLISRHGEQPTPEGVRSLDSFTDQSTTDATTEP